MNKFSNSERAERIGGPIQLNALKVKVILCLNVFKKWGGGWRRRQMKKTGRCVCVCVCLFICALFSCTCSWMFPVRRVSGQTRMNQLCVWSISSPPVSLTRPLSAPVIGHRGRRHQTSSSDSCLFTSRLSRCGSAELLFWVVYSRPLSSGAACVLKASLSTVAFADGLCDYTVLFKAHRQTKSSVGGTSSGCVVCQSHDIIYFCCP